MIFQILKIYKEKQKTQFYTGFGLAVSQSEKSLKSF